MFTLTQLIHLKLLVADRITKIVRKSPNNELTSEKVEYAHLIELESLITNLIDEEKANVNEQ